MCGSYIEVLEFIKLALGDNMTMQDIYNMCDADGVEVEYDI